MGIFMEQEVSYVTYSDREENIVESGFPAVSEILRNGSCEEQRRLLFCLDKYLDPYFHLKLNYKDLLTDALQTLCVTSDNTDVIEDALQLLSDYLWGPFPILEEHLQSVPESVRGYASYVANMYKMLQLEQQMLDECRKIYEESRAGLSADLYEGFPNEMYVLHCNANVSDEQLGDLSVCSNPDNCEEMFHYAEGRYRPVGVSARDCIEFQKPRQGANGYYFPKAQFFFRISLEEGSVFLVYYFGPRWGRGQRYSILAANGEESGRYTLSNPQPVWVV